LANTEVSRAAAAELGLVRVCMEQPNSDISAYTYERTLLMEQRHAMLAQMKIKKKNSLTVILNTSHASYVRMAVHVYRQRVECLKSVLLIYPPVYRRALSVQEMGNYLLH